MFLLISQICPHVDNRSCMDRSFFSELGWRLVGRRGYRAIVNLRPFSLKNPSIRFVLKPISSSVQYQATCVAARRGVLFLNLASPHVRVALLFGDTVCGRIPQRQAARWCKLQRCPVATGLSAYLGSDCNRAAAFMSLLKCARQTHLTYS